MSSTYESSDGETLDPLGVGVETDDVEARLDRAHREREAHVALSDDDELARLFFRVGHDLP